VRVRFFPPEGGGLAPGEAPSALPVRLLAEIRGHAPIAAAGRRRAAAPAEPATEPASS
jgi:hypothetical protein